MKILVVFGTRPELIKLAPIILEARLRAPAVTLTICSTGQHKEMLNQALQAFDIKADVSLNLMQANQSITSVAALLLTALDKTLRRHNPDVVVVQGDTTTALVGALVSFFLGIPVAHIEAGLRTGDLNSPFPEEGNRKLIAQLARWHFAPTKRAAENLYNEGVMPHKVTVTGNTVVDAIKSIKAMWEIQPYSGQAVNFFPDKPLVLITTHRRENFGARLRNICKAIRILSQSHPEFGFVFPVHLNPNVTEIVLNELQEINNLKLTAPVDFETSLYLQSRAVLILTDSGGIQEEAPSFGVPCIVMRQHTERTEGLDQGFAYLAGMDTTEIVQAFEACLKNRPAAALSGARNPYGDGFASARIITTIVNQATVSLENQ